jgi:hypothetical protein
LEFGLVGLAVKTLVKADGGQAGKVLLGLGRDRYRDLVVGGLLHDLVVQDEAVLVFDHAHPQTQLHRYPRLALADPLGGCEFFDIHRGRQRKGILATTRQPRQDSASAPC